MTPRRDLRALAEAAPVDALQYAAERASCFAADAALSDDFEAGRWKAALQEAAAAMFQAMGHLETARTALPELLAERDDYREALGACRAILHYLFETSEDQHVARKAKQGLDLSSAALARHQEPQP